MTWLQGKGTDFRYMECPRCTDVVQRDARQLLGIRGWRSKAANRDELMRLMRETKARKGL
jgi:hypothetical protein